MGNPLSELLVVLIYVTITTIIFKKVAISITNYLRKIVIFKNRKDEPNDTN